MATNVDHSEDSIDHPEQVRKMFLVSAIDLYSTLSAITKNLDSLQILQISYGLPSPLPTENLQCCGKLEHLRHLMLDCSLQNVSSFIDAIASADLMQSLSLCYGIMGDQLIEGIVKFKNLKTLHFFEMENLLEHHVKQLTTLNNLSELKICCFHHTSSPLTSNGIVSLITKLDKLKSLQFTKFDWGTFAGYDQIVEICRKRVVKVPLKIISSFSSHSDTIQQDPEHREYVKIVDSK